MSVIEKIPGFFIELPLAIGVVLGLLATPFKLASLSENPIESLMNLFQSIFKKIFGRE